MHRQMYLEKENLFRSKIFVGYIHLHTFNELNRVNALPQTVHWCFGVEWIADICALKARWFFLVFPQCGQIFGDWLWVSLCVRSVFRFFIHLPQISHWTWVNSLSRWVRTWLAIWNAYIIFFPQISHIVSAVFRGFFSWTFVIWTFKHPTDILNQIKRIDPM